MALNDVLNLRQLLTPANLRPLAAPLLIIVILSMMVLPLPVFLLDVFFTFNIAISVMVMLVAMYSTRPLDFSVFPTVLLVTTLLRLSLNVASTRIVLLEGHAGPDAAGKVIEAFGHFLVGGNTAVGLVVFIILTVINFVVITKGAGRIAEVSARFTLDAMPGKQMAIDADLNAGLIDEKEAKRRRKEIAQEADFYGAMDGASKFVRGDAVAGIIILMINIIGGLFVGIMQHDMAVGDAAHTYTLLTIGDGLVAQIPSLIVSVAAGLVVSRVGDEGDVGGLVIGQLFSNPQVMALTGAIIGVLGLIPGMPNLVFLLLAATLGGMAWMRRKRIVEETAAAAAPEAAAQAPMPAADNLEASWNDVSQVDVLGLEVGYRLIPMVDKGQDGELLKRIRGLRKKFAQEVGFLSAPVHIRDNLELKPNGYRSRSRASRSAAGEAYPGPVPGHQPGPRVGASRRERDQGPRLWSARGMDRRLDARAGAGARLHGGRCQHRGGHPPQPRHPQPRRRAARPPGDPGPARPSRQGVAQAGRGPRAQAAAARHRAARAAEPARGGRQHPRHAQHHRGARRERAARAGPRPAHHKGAGGAGPRHPAGPFPGQCRGPGHGARAGPGAHPHAGHGRGRRGRGDRARA
jgi:flagellar biosynthesis protein FlhA